MNAKLTAAALVALFTLSAQAATEIRWWHSMDGALNEKVNEIANNFNASQAQYKVIPVFKGSYDEALSAGIAAYRAGEAPHILQVFEVGTATMMNAKGAVRPLSTVMKDAGESFDPKSYVPAIAGYYTSAKGEMLSFPFNSSTTVFYYNKDAFKKAGLDENTPPRTWAELIVAAQKLKDSGSKCPYTTDWQTWVHLESFSTLHNTLYATHDNGFGGPEARLVFNSPLHVQHIANLQKMLQEGLFVYGGRKSDAQVKFFNGECAMNTGSSSAYANIRKNAKFSFGVAPLPYYADVKGAPANPLLGGASLWVLNGRKAEEYKGVAQFFAYLSQTKVQADWHQATGYLPATTAAYELTKSSGFYEKNPGTNVAVEQMIVKTTNKSRGVRLGNMALIRSIVDEELEAVWGGKKTAKAALDSAVTRGNEQLARFQKIVRE